jgi:exopolysaccharide biosynthesis polyprenyl glycosylphosphotransferase
MTENSKAIAYEAQSLRENQSAPNQGYLSLLVYSSGFSILLMVLHITLGLTYNLLLPNLISFAAFSAFTFLIQRLLLHSGCGLTPAWRTSLALLVSVGIGICFCFFQLGSDIKWNHLATLASAVGGAFAGALLPQHLHGRVLILGAGNCGRQLLATIRRHPRSGLTQIGFLDDDPRKIGTEVDGVPVLGATSRLSEVIHRTQSNLVIMAITHQKSPKLINTLTRVSLNGTPVTDMPSFYEILAGKVPLEHISDFGLLFNSLNKSKFYIRYLKRFMDLGIASLLIVLTAPIFLIISLAIKLGSPGPVFYWQYRLGHEEKPFKIFKFRTMIQDAEDQGPQWAVNGDPRITRVGRWLRRLRLDELPQLINIIKGEMSLIGPRPERAVFIRLFKEAIPYYSYRLMVKPGLTGWAQVMYSYAASLEETKEKLQYDLYYVKNMGLFLDLAIILKTIRIVLFGRGI